MCGPLTGMITVTEPAELVVNMVDFTNPTNCDDNNGTITIMASGGTGMFEYSVDGGMNWQSSHIFSGLSGGTYQISVRDLNETTCIISAQDVILQSAICGITLTKEQTGGPNPATDGGQIITYTITLVNEGNIALNNVVATEIYPGMGMGTLGDPMEDMMDDDILEPGETWTYIATYEVTTADIEANMDLVNTISVVTNEIPGPTIATERTPVSTMPEMRVTKTQVGGQDPVTSPGILEYEVEVDNVGTVNLTNLVVTDLLPDGSIIMLTNPQEEDAVPNDGILQVDGKWVFSISYSVTQNDIDNGGLLVNYVSVTSDEIVEPEEDEVTTPINQNPQVSLEKQAVDVDGDMTGNGPVDQSGEVITYEITVRNEGNVSLSGILLQEIYPGAGAGMLDAPIESITSDGTLEVGEEWLYIATYTATLQDILDGQSLVNTVILTTDQTAETLMATETTPVNTCVPLDCYGRLNLSLGPDCMLEITPATLLVNRILFDLYPEYFEVVLTLENGAVIADNKLRLQHVGRTIYAQVSWVGPYSCPANTCMSEITLNGDKIPVIDGTHNKTVYCFDPYLNLDPEGSDYIRPTASMSCTDQVLKVDYSGDWVEIFECVPGVQDTVKIIYREWSTTTLDGVRASAFDTIVVVQPPPISEENLFFVEKDTTYCGQGSFGPYLILPDVCPDDGESDCDTLYLLNKDGSPRPLVSNICGLLVHTDAHLFSSDACESLTRFKVEIKQNCYGAVPNTSCSVVGSNFEIQGQIGESLYTLFEFWHVDLDTIAPKIVCKYDQFGSEQVLWPQSLDGLASNNTHCFETGGKPVILISGNAHDCGANLILPEVCVFEDWSGISYVKARIEGVGTYLFDPSGEICTVDDSTGNCYTSDIVLTLYNTELPIPVIYEVADNCYNISRDTCFILVKDQVAPVVTTLKKSNIDLGTKKVWVDATAFDEQSWDNCGINLMLARRSEWESILIALCDSVEVCYVSSHGDTIWKPFLNTGGAEEVSQYYAGQLQWLKEDEAYCGSLLYNAWQYDLMRYATQVCKGSGEVGDEYFYDLVYHAIEEDLDFRNHFDTPESSLRPGCITEIFSELDLLRELPTYRQLGGGWSQSVVFDCSDACGLTQVELLAIDYWCNWSKGWTDVWIEDKSPIQVAKDVNEDIEISCITFKETGLDKVVDSAIAGEADAKAILDSIFGGYEKAWVDPYGTYVDAEGNPIEQTLSYVDRRQCTCTTTVVQVEVYDEHLGYYEKDSVISHCYTIADTLDLWQGIVLAQCASEVNCEQTIWSDFDACGQGYIYRKWSLSQGCFVDSETASSHRLDTVIRIQRIWVGNSCTLNKYMFELPKDTIIDACNIEYATDGSGYVVGAADVLITGEPRYTFDDDCRVVGLGRKDKVYKVVGGDDACYKIYRTWYFADWCSGKPVDAGWWRDHESVQDSFVQVILVRDTLAPLCSITGPDVDGGLIEAGGCFYNLDVSVVVEDECSVSGYAYSLREISDPTSPVSIESNVIESVSEILDLTFEDLSSGKYELRVRVTDNCQNESFCTYTLTIVTGQKPAAVCVTSLTAELVGWDQDGDGIIDSAHAVVWAKEFNSSSQASCGGDTSDLTYFIELLDGVGDDTFDDDTTYLTLDCDDLGLQPVRMWVLDPLGTFDFCDVMLEVQDNNNICDDLSVTDINQAMTSEIEGVLEVHDRKNGDAYDSQDVDINRRLDSEGSALRSEDGRFALYQNRPNPFRTDTKIGFYLPRAMKARLLIYDVTGKLLKVIDGEFIKGYQEVEILYEDLDTEGMIYYQLDTEEFTATRSMILMK